MQAGVRLFSSGLMALVFLLVGASACFAVEVDSDQESFAQFYYGGYASAVHILDEQLDSPAFELDDEDMTVDVTDVEELYGAAIRLEGYKSDEKTTATVTLDGGSSITLSSADAYELSGISAEYFLEAYVSLLDGSSVDVSLEGDLDGEYWASGIGLYDISLPKSAEVTLAGGSSVKVSVVADGDDTSATADAVGVEIENAAHAVVDLSGASSVTVDAASYQDNSSSAEATGVSLEADDCEVTLTTGSSISAEAKVEVTGDSSTATAAGIYAGYADTVDISLSGASSIYAEATGSGAFSWGGVIEDSLHAVLKVTQGSTIAATATAVDNSVAGAYDSAAGAYASSFALGMFDVGEVDVTITDADIVSTMSATAIQDVAAEGDEGGSEALIGMDGIPGGLSVYDFDSADVLVQNSTITVDAQATASSVVGGSSAGIGYMGMDGALAGISLIDGTEANVDLRQSVVDVTATATAGDEAMAVAVGIQMLETGDNSTLSLQDSSVSVVTTATASAEEGVAITEAIGVYATTEGAGGVFSFDNSTVSVEALSETAGAYGIAVGVAAGYGEYAINLTNGSQIRATQSSGMGIEGLSGSMGIYSSAADVDVMIDATSSISADWAAYISYDEEEYEGYLSVDNSGLIDGRLLVYELVNNPSGVLRASFGSDDVDGEGIGYFASEDYYFTSHYADLADGTTFRIHPTDTLGFTAVADSASYALFAVEDAEGTDSWSMDALNLSATSSLLGLSWHEDSNNQDTLIVTATLLSPAEAGLSANAGRAFYAALDDGLFTFDTDPEEWVPNVSGAFVSGMTQSLGTSYFSIGNRLGALMGMNSGDEVVASNGMWFSIRYTEADQSRRDGIDGFDADTTGLSIGIDREFGDMVLGIAYTRGSTDADADDNRAKFDMTDNLFSLYGSYDGGNWYTEAILSAGFGSVDSMRYNGAQSYEGDFDSTSYNAKVEAGMKLNASGVQVNPMLAMEYSSKDYDSYTESGDSLALHIHSQDYEVFKVGAGVTANKEFQRSWGSITPEVSAMLNYDVVNDRVATTANFIGGSTSFVAKGIEPAETSWDLGAALTVASLGEQNVSFRVGYDYSGRQDFEAHSFTGKVRFEF